jgi:hypothetical protein
MCFEQGFTPDPPEPVTGFHVPAGKIDRLPPLYAPDPQTGEFLVWDEAEGGATARRRRFRAAAEEDLCPLWMTSAMSTCRSVKGSTAAAVRGRTGDQQTSWGTLGRPVSS